MRVLIIEDQENLANLIKKGLEAEGFAADYVLDGKAGWLRLELNHEDYDVVILDLMLPKMDGMEICKNAREKKIDTPIIMLTAKDGIDDMISGLNIGADDYLVKPFSFDNLLARTRAVLRRPKPALSQEYRVGNIKLDNISKKVFFDSQEIKLTLKEFSLLEYLMRHPNQVLSREQILSNIWDFAFDSFSNVVDVHITNLRKKLGDHDCKILETVRGVGYRLNG
jgi:DNA-binding response OmpR family regulator